MILSLDFCFVIIPNHNHYDDLHDVDNDDRHHADYFSAALTQPQWTALPVLEDPAMMNRCLIIIIIIIIIVVIIIISSS